MRPIKEVSDAIVERDEATSHTRIAVRTLRVLLVEDQEDDAALVLRELKRHGIEPIHRRVETEATMRAALESQDWDLILSDYSMPQFSALAALEVMKSSGHDLPFIIVSGTIGEETAVEAMRAGAQDFLLKGRLARLVPAIERELRDAAVRAEGRKLHEQLILSDRMASVGTLAAGVAHEINNPLAALMANLDVMMLELGRADDAGGLDPMHRQLIEEPLTDARETAERIRQIVRDLKVFSRSDEERRERVDVHRVLESSLRMAWNEIRHRARMVKDYGRDVPRVEANEGRLGQVFLNLVVNAAQSIPEGAAAANEIRVSTYREGSFAVVEVRDTGAGIPKENLAAIFNPFFTTKAIGVGTGLGLAICHRIVTSIGGAIEVQSEVGKGACFRVSIPMAERELPRGAIERPSVVAPVRRAHVLYVDDEPLLGKTVQRTLRDHDVVALTNGRDALERIAAGERFDVILCDLMMPEITGIALYEELARIAPDQAARMVFITGGAFTPRSRAFLDRVKNPCLEKPFEPEALHAIVAKVMR